MGENSKFQEKDAALYDAVARYNQGDASAWTTIYQSSDKYIYKIIHDIVKDHHTTEDLMQETYLRIYNNIASLQEPKAFYAWAGRIATHLTLRHLQKYRKETLITADEEGNTDYIFDKAAEDDELIIPESVIMDQEKRRLIAEILDNLSAEQKIAVQFYYFEEMSVGEIAEQMGCAEGTVKSRLNYARKSIKAAVEDLAQTHGTKLYSLAALPIISIVFYEGVETFFAGLSGSAIAMGAAKEAALLTGVANAAAQTAGVAPAAQGVAGAAAQTAGVAPAAQGVAGAAAQTAGVAPAAQGVAGAAAQTAGVAPTAQGIAGAATAQTAAGTTSASTAASVAAGATAKSGAAAFFATAGGKAVIGIAAAAVIATGTTTTVLVVKHNNEANNPYVNQNSNGPVIDDSAPGTERPSAPEDDPNTIVAMDSKELYDHFKKVNSYSNVMATYGEYSFDVYYDAYSKSLTMDFAGDAVLYAENGDHIYADDSFAGRKEGDVLYKMTTFSGYQGATSSDLKNYLIDHYAMSLSNFVSVEVTSATYDESSNTYILELTGMESGGIEDRITMTLNDQFFVTDCYGDLYQNGSLLSSFSAVFNYGYSDTASYRSTLLSDYEYADGLTQRVVTLHLIKGGQEVYTEKISIPVDEGFGISWMVPDGFDGTAYSDLNATDPVGIYFETDDIYFFGN